MLRRLLSLSNLQKSTSTTQRLRRLLSTPRLLPTPLSNCIALSQHSSGRYAKTPPTTVVSLSEIRQAYQHLRALDGEANVLHHVFGSESIENQNNYIKLLKYMFDRTSRSASRAPRRNKRNEHKLQLQSLNISRDIFSELTTLHKSHRHQFISPPTSFTTTTEATSPAHPPLLQPMSKKTYEKFIVALCTTSQHQPNPAVHWEEASLVLKQQLSHGMIPSPSLFSRVLLACPLTKAPGGIHGTLQQVVLHQTHLLPEHTTHIYNTALTALNRAGLYVKLVWEDVGCTRGCWLFSVMEFARPIQLYNGRLESRWAASICVLIVSFFSFDV